MNRLVVRRTAAALAQHLRSTAGDGVLVVVGHDARHGSERFARDGERAGIVALAARTDEGISSFVVEAGTPGLVVEPAYHKLGWHASDTHGLLLDGCRVPEVNVLGELGTGFRNFLAILDDGRIAISALAGLKIIEFFGISIASFQVGGGTLLLITALQMLNAKPPEGGQVVCARESVRRRRATTADASGSRRAEASTMRASG